MKPFDPTATCPKCGHDDIGAQFHAERTTDTGRALPECMIRRCRRCDYGWLEEPLDAHPPEPEPPSGSDQPLDAMVERAHPDDASRSAELDSRVRPRIGFWGAV